MERIDLGQFSDAYETYDVWLDFGPREGPVSSSRGPDGVWHSTGPESIDRGPVLCWQAPSGRRNGIYLDQCLDIAITTRGINLAPAFVGEAPDTMTGDEKLRFVALAVSALTTQPRAAGRFEIKWVPLDPDLPF